MVEAPGGGLFRTTGPVGLALFVSVVVVVVVARRDADPEMLLPVTTLAALCVLLEAADSAGPSGKELELIFGERTRSDWEKAWHREKYTRCRETLIRHLYWACEKDIYRIKGKTDKRDYNEIEEFPWIFPEEAKRFLRFRRKMNRRSGSSITRECCSSSGCTWEEYAEYCPTNKRYTNYV